MTDHRVSHSSPLRTILNATIPRDRVISKFPPAYHPDGTPYQQMNFHTKVKTACAENRTGVAGLKISKGVVVGDVAVGKTSLVNRFCHKIFDRDYKATIGVDFEVEKFSILSTPFTLQLWDTAGQERFKCIAASYYRGANVVIVVFDLSDTTSLVNAEKWMNTATENGPNPRRFLVGTKRDLLSDAAFQDMEAEAIKMANFLKAEYWALSSKTGENVQDFFFRLSTLTFEAALLKEIERPVSATKHIGNDLISVNTPDKDLFETTRKKQVKCCS